MQRLVGGESAAFEAIIELGEDPAECRGAKRLQSPGGLWVVCEGRNEVPGSRDCNRIMI